MVAVSPLTETLYVSQTIVISLSVRSLGDGLYTSSKGDTGGVRLVHLKVKKCETIGCFCSNHNFISHLKDEC